MPAIIAHLLVLEKALEDLKEKEDAKFTRFLGKIEKNTSFAYLGSLGPDLPYYQNVVSTTIKMLVLRKSDKPLGINNFAYPLHSCNPNVFAMKLLELAWKESEYWDPAYWEPEDEHKFAFLCGYLSHMAADQIIHPIVNKIVGPYYKDQANSEAHRECEIYEDISLFLELKGENPLDEKFNRWIDIAQGSLTNAPQWFRYFMQKAFLEAFGIFIDEQVVENWIDGTLFITRALDNLGPYPTAYKEIEREKAKKRPAGKFKKYYVDPNYMEHFNEAVDLTKIYIQAVFESYELDEFSGKHRERFLEIVRNADLSAPLEKNILEHARMKLNEEFHPVN